jgi:hypothetical protein
MNDRTVWTVSVIMSESERSLRIVRKFPEPPVKAFLKPEPLVKAFVKPKIQKVSRNSPFEPTYACSEQCRD